MSLLTPDSLDPCLPRLEAAPHVYLGYSGGLDSSVLLHLLSRRLPRHKFTAVHINHGLQASATKWEERCRRRCEILGVAFIARTVAVNLEACGLEEAARDARYREFARLLQPGDIFLLAHHRDDQVETVLFRLMRGSGPRGLAGMPFTRSLGRGQLLRPMLAFGRSELEDYAVQNGLDWIEDLSNLDTDHDRNFIRHRVIPVLAHRWPDYSARVVHSAAMCREAEQLAEMVADEDLERMEVREERRGASIPLDGFTAISRPRQINLLRRWFARLKLKVPGHRVMESILLEVVPARADASPLVAWRGGELRRCNGRLFAAGNLPPMPAQTPSTLSWDGAGELKLPDGSFLRLTAGNSGGLCLPPDGQLEIRFRAGSERCRPAGRTGSASLKKLFQEYRLEPWLRSRVPLLYVRGELAAVGDLFVCEGFQARDSELGKHVVWAYQSLTPAG